MRAPRVGYKDSLFIGRAVIQEIEAASMIGKGRVLGISRHEMHGQAWLFGTLLGVAQSRDIAPTSDLVCLSQMQHLPPIREQGWSLRCD